MPKRHDARVASLLARVRKATEVRGKKAELARFLGVPPQRVNDWLSERFTPSGEFALGMDEWVRRAEEQQKTPGSASNTAKGRKTRQLKSDHEKSKRARKGT